MGRATRQLQIPAPTEQPRPIAGRRLSAGFRIGSQTVAFRDVSAPLSCLNLFHGLLEYLVDFAQHLPSAVGSVMLAQLGARLVLPQLIDPIPEQLRPASRMPGKFLEVRVEEPKGRDGLALATEQVAMHEVVMLVAREDTQLNLGVQRRDARHHRQVVIDIRAPVLADGQHVNILSNPLEERLFRIRDLDLFIFRLKEILVFLDAPHVLVPRHPLLEALLRDHGPFLLAVATRPLSPPSGAPRGRRDACHGPSFTRYDRDNASAHYNRSSAGITPPLLLAHTHDSSQVSQARAARQRSILHTTPNP